VAGEFQPPQQMLATAAVLLAKTSKPLCNQQPAGVASAAVAESYSGFAETGTKTCGAVRILPKGEVAEASRQAEEQS